jgi:hypothetical protein
MYAHKRLALVPLAAVGLMVALAGAATASGTSLQDPNASGFIGLCDRGGHQVTRGEVATKPFVWRAVSSEPAAAPYNKAGATATLYAYQPRQGVAAGDWSGSQLTASARFSNPAHPMAAATSKDISLANFVAEFAPTSNGLLQLRIFLGAPNEQVDSVTYPATTIQVTGATWHVVNPQPVACNSGTAESIESILLPASTPSSDLAHSAATRPTTSVSSPAAATASTAETTPATGASAAAAPSPSNAALESVSSNRSSGGHTGLVVTVIVVGAVLLCIGGVAMNRRTRRRSAP